MRRVLCKSLGAVRALLLTLQARATYYENVTCTTATLDELENIQ